MNIHQAIESIKQLNGSDRALLAHCLISSLETQQDENVEQAWYDLAEERYQELVSARVESISWEQIKKVVKD